MKTFKGLKVPKYIIDKTQADYCNLASRSCSGITCAECLFDTSSPSAVKAFEEWRRDNV